MMPWMTKSFHHILQSHSGLLAQFFLVDAICAHDNFPGAEIDEKAKRDSLSRNSIR